MSDTLVNWRRQIGWWFAEWFGNTAPSPFADRRSMTTGESQRWSNSPRIGDGSAPASPVSVRKQQLPRRPDALPAWYQREVRTHRIEVPSLSSLWQDRGWHQDGTGWRGVYRAGRRSWQGSAVPTRSGKLDMYIQDPPEGVLSGTHGQCFVYKGSKGHWVHFDPTAPTNLSQAIGAIEWHLAEAI